MIYILQRIKHSDYSFTPEMIKGNIYISDKKYENGNGEFFHIGKDPYNPYTDEHRGGFYVENFEVLAEINDDNKLLKLLLK
jgi:hypothetical protein